MAVSFLNLLPLDICRMLSFYQTYSQMKSLAIIKYEATSDKTAESWHFFFLEFWKLKNIEQVNFALDSLGARVTKLNIYYRQVVDLTNNLPKQFEEKHKKHISYSHSTVVATYLLNELNANGTIEPFLNEADQGVINCGFVGACIRKNYTFLVNTLLDAKEVVSTPKLSVPRKMTEAQLFEIGLKLLTQKAREYLSSEGLSKGFVAACKYGNNLIVDHLIDRQMEETLNIKISKEAYISGLLKASKRGSDKLVRTILCNTDVGAVFDYSTFEAACRKATGACLKLIMQRAQINHDTRGKGFILACVSGNKSVVESFLQDPSFGSLSEEMKVIRDCDQKKHFAHKHNYYLRHDQGVKNSFYNAGGAKDYEKLAKGYDILASMGPTSTGVRFVDDSWKDCSNCVDTHFFSCVSVETDYVPDMQQTGLIGKGFLVVCRKNNYSIVEQFLKHSRIDTKELGLGFKCAWACFAKSIDAKAWYPLLELLYNQIKLTTESKNDAFCLACQKGDEELVRKFLPQDNFSLFVDFVVVGFLKSDKNIQPFLLTELERYPNGIMEAFFAACGKGLIIDPIFQHASISEDVVDRGIDFAYTNHRYAVVKTILGSKLPVSLKARSKNFIRACRDNRREIVVDLTVPLDVMRNGFKEACELGNELVVVFFIEKHFDYLGKETISEGLKLATLKEHKSIIQKIKDRQPCIVM